MASCAKIAKVDTKVIKLDVGGTKYKTSLATLLMYPDSYLGQLFSGKFDTPTNNEDGEYFIDANGEMFRYILDFLRRSKLMLPEDFKELDLLCGEADFFQIEPLIQELEFLKNEFKESKKKKILNVWGGIVNEFNKNKKHTLKVSYFQKPGGSFEQMNNMNDRTTSEDGRHILEKGYSAQGYINIMHKEGLCYYEVEAYLYTHGITAIPEICNYFSNGRSQEKYSLDLWSRDKTKR